MRHVDDYLDAPDANPIAKEFLEHARRPAVDKDYEWLRLNAPTVTWRGKEYLCVGASRMGDVWLRNPYLSDAAHYHHRVDVAELSNWHHPVPRQGTAP